MKTIHLKFVPNITRAHHIKNFGKVKIIVVSCHLFLLIFQSLASRSQFPNLLSRMFSGTLQEYIADFPISALKLFWVVVQTSFQAHQGQMADF